MKKNKEMTILGIVFLILIVSVILVVRYFSKPEKITLPFTPVSPSPILSPSPINTPEPSVQRKIYLIETIKELKSSVRELQNEDKTLFLPDFLFE